MKPLCTLIMMFILATLVNAAPEDMSGREILEEVDRVANAPADREMLSTMTLIDKSGNLKERTVQMLQKGPDKRLSRFLSPADQKGISVLTLPDSVIYLYLPAFKQVKRIASHVKHNRYAGTDFSYEDMEAKRYADHYDARLLKKEPGKFLIELTPKNPEQSEYSKLVMQVMEETYLAEWIEYFNGKGELFKRLTNSRFESIEGYWMARRTEMYDLEADHKTLIVFDEIQFDRNLPDDMFSKRYLTR